MKYRHNTDTIQKYFSPFLRMEKEYKEKTDKIMKKSLKRVQGSCLS